MPLSSRKPLTLHIADMQLVTPVRGPKGSALNAANKVWRVIALPWVECSEMSEEKH